MKPRKLIDIGILALLLVTTTSSVYAQQEEKPKEEQPAKPDEHPAKPEEHLNMPPHQQEAKPEEHPRDKTPTVREQGQERERESEHVTINKNVTVVNGERRIPDDRFRANFGNEHTFTVNHITVISGQPRFQYAGFWFGLGVPWPVAWAYADPVYVEFIDGQYYLFNVRHPGIRIGIVLL